MENDVLSMNWNMEHTIMEYLRTRNLSRTIKYRIDIRALQTHKKGKATFWHYAYDVIYRGVKNDARAKEGVGLMAHKKYTSAITMIEYVSERIRVTNTELQNSLMCVISAYALEEGKPAHGKDKFYEDLQDIFCRVSSKEKIILMEMCIRDRYCTSSTE